jgi:hypothetical protein
VGDPIVFISNQKVKEGKLSEYAQYYREVAELTERTKPRTVAHLAYASEDGAAISIVHVFPDAEALATHMQGVEDLANKAYEFMEITSFEIYGDPGDAVLDNMKSIAGSGIAVTIKPQAIGGYIRFEAE